MQAAILSSQGCWEEKQESLSVRSLYTQILNNVGSLGSLTRLKIMHSGVKQEKIHPAKEQKKNVKVI